jgi:hypothetical protein
MGGKPIALTCKGCNTTAGHVIDIEVWRRAESMRLNAVIRNLVDGEARRLTLKIGSERVNVRVVSERNSPVKVEILERWNAPRKVERIRAYGEEHVRGGTWTGGELHVESVGRYDPRLALVGDLKAAFIAAFATFGYRYAFNTRLALVRQQIRTPHAQVLDGWIAAFHLTETDRCLALMPEPISTVMVRLGWVDVLLPWLGSPLNFYDAVAALCQAHGPREVIGERIEWPTTLMMELDFQSGTLFGYPQ